MQATCVRVPVLVGHLEAVWIETENALWPEQARKLLAAAPGLRVVDLPTPARGGGRRRSARRPHPQRHGTANGLALWVVGDNLRKGAALNAMQIAELLLSRHALAA